MSSEDEFHTVDDDLHDFIVDEPGQFTNDNEINEHDEGAEEAGEIQSGDENTDSEDEKPDRLKEFSTALKPNETARSKILKAHISVLVSALGGPDHTSNNNPPPYKLGHDALACLKDLKRWIRSVDDTNQTFDVAIACGETGVVMNDLVVILCQWDNQLAGKSNLPPIRNKKTMERIMLSILELLVSLTWPQELTPESTEEQKLQLANLRKFQIIYKKHILTYNKGQTLKAVLRLILPIMSKEKEDREKKDNQVLKLALFFIRNILYIKPIGSTISMKTSKELTSIDNMPSNVTMEDISLNNVLSVFKKNKVLTFLLTMSSSVGSEFNKNFFGQIVLECINLMVKNVKFQDIMNQSKAFNRQKKNLQDLQENQRSINQVESINSTVGMQLSDLLQEESRRKNVQNQNLSTRHGRFGTLLSIQGDEQNYVISGQEALLNSNVTMDKLDRSKKWQKPPQFKYDSDKFISDEKQYLSPSSTLIFHNFICDFLVGECFNNLISNVSSILSSADDMTHINPYDNATYFLTMSWFFNYMRNRNEYYKAHPQEFNSLSEEEKSLAGFQFINDGLSQTNFILILNYFRSSFEKKNWSAVHVAMTCFLELLLISHSLFISNPSMEDLAEDSQELLDKELGEGIIRNLFTSYDFLNVLVQVPQSASKHSPSYLSKCIYLVHILLKSFESFTKENITLYIKKRRKKYKKDKKSLYNDIESRMNSRVEDLMDESDEEADHERAKSEKLERELDLQRTELRFFHTSTVNSYIDYLSEYEDLSHEEVKRCLSYFHRLFVVKKDHNALFRLDFMIILQKLRGYLPKKSSIRNHVDDFIIYFMKKFKPAFERFPNPIEILFPRFEEQAAKSFLNEGIIVAKSNSSQPRLAKDVEFIRDFTLDEKVKILITALIYQEKESFLKWLITALENFIKIRIQHLIDDPTSITSNDDNNVHCLLTPESYARYMINNQYVRCLLSLASFELPDILEEKVELPKNIPTGKVVELLELIKKWIKEQPVSFEDGKDPFYFMRSKEYDDYGYNDDNVYNFSDEDIAFETQGTATQSKYMEELDNLDKMEARISSSNTLGVARKKTKEKEPTRERSKEKERKKRSSKHRGSKHRSSSQHEPEGYHGPSKSNEYIHDSDEESDDEKDQQFFAREEKLRKLLSESGGIINTKQLEEFKKVWSSVLNDPNQNVDESVTRAIESASKNFKASQVEESQDLGLSQYAEDSQLSQSQSTIQFTQASQLDQSDQSDQSDREESTRLEFSSDEESQPESDDAVDKENQIPVIKRILEDDDDDDTSFISRRKRLRLDDDDDDE
ncbi:topoisomerase 1-associated factor 1 [[Candida] jaroonii]|uniref:Topoisomerase 1-associated factor 1 n=1 Tax=[Candida] jaroonii TaxID=467808 RepID=A0ACA9Y2U0_9ASCO|nr:topoisomerase 1-associated factor 1 [[Candida] jaroonii]